MIPRDFWLALMTAGVYAKALQKTAAQIKIEPLEHKVWATGYTASTIKARECNLAALILGKWYLFI